MAQHAEVDKPSASPTLLTRAELLRTFRVGKEAEVKFRCDPVDPLPHITFGRRILYPLGEVIEWARRRASRQGSRRGS